MSMIPDHSLVLVVDSRGAQRLAETIKREAEARRPRQWLEVRTVALPLVTRRVAAQQRIRAPFRVAVVQETGDPHISGIVLAKMLRKTDPHLEIIILRDPKLRPEYVLQGLEGDERVLVLPADVHDAELGQAIARSIEASTTRAAEAALRDELRRLADFVQTRLSVRSSDAALDALSIIQLVVSRRPGPTVSRAVGEDGGAVLARIVPTERLAAFSEQALGKIWLVLDAAAELSRTLRLLTDEPERLAER